MIIKENNNITFLSKIINFSYKSFIYIYPLLVSLIVYIGYLNGVTPLIYLGFILLFISLFTQKIENNFFYLLFYLSNERLFLLDNLPIGPIALYIIALSIKVLIISKFKINKNYFLLASIIFIFSVVKGFVKSTEIIDTEIIRFILNIFIVFNIFKWFDMSDQKEFATKSIVWYIYGAVVTSFISVINSLIISDGALLSSYFRLAPVNQDPNYYGVAIAVVIAMLIVLLKIYIKKKLLLLIGILLFLTFGAMTQSRAFLLTCVPNFILLIFLFSKQNTKTKLLLALLFFVLIFTFVNSNLMEYIYRALGRLEYAGLNDTRLILWSEYLKRITETGPNLFFGIGKDYSVTIYNVAPHNFLLGSWAYYGLILTLIFVLTYYYLFLIFKKYFIIKFRFFMYFPILGSLVGYFFVDGITDNLFFYGIFLWFMSIFLLDYENRKDFLND